MELSTISEEVKNILLENRRIVSGQQFTVSTDKQFFFDSCLSSIVLRHFEPKSAEKEIISLLNFQLSSGKITQNKESYLIHSPLIAYAAFEVFKISKNFDFLEKIFPKLDRYYKWLSTIRDPYSKNILSIIHPDESTYRKAICWDQFKNVEKDLDTTYKNLDYNDSAFLQKEYFDIKDIFFNCVYLESLKSMIRISEVLKGDCSFYKRKYDYSKESMKKYMYDQTKNLFFSLDQKWDKMEFLTPTIFSPLFSNLLTQSQSTNLVNKYLLNTQQFWTEYPIPTASFSEKKFDSTAFWRGSSSITMNWFVFRGLLNYNLIEAAEILYERTLNMITKVGFYEHYNSITGEGLGIKNPISACLILDMERELQLHVL